VDQSDKFKDVLKELRMMEKFKRGLEINEAELIKQYYKNYRF